MTKEDRKETLPAILNARDSITHGDDAKALAPLPARSIRTSGNFRVRLRAKLRDNLQSLVLTLLVLLFLLAFLAPRIFIVIDSGAVGVKYDLRYGTQVDYIYSEGMNIIAPWNRMYIYNIRIQETKRTLDVLTADGLVIKLDLSIRYHPEVEMIGVLHREVGPDYVEKIVVPEVESVIRTSLGKLMAEQLYTGVVNKAPTEYEQYAERLAPPPPTSADGPQRPNQGAAERPGLAASIPENNEAGTLPEIINRSIRQVSKRYVLIDDVIITKSMIPDQIQMAIQAKLEQKELAKAQQYRIDKATKEIEIKTLEATSNYTLSDSLDAKILTLKGIEATKELATSANSKIIVIGNGPGGLPIILNSEKEK